jgi:DNA modification methylase
LNRLYYGDNLDVLREHIPDESVDLIYLDPPFNSNANYNVLFKSLKGEQSEAQITAFEDSWHWTRESARTLEQLKFKHGELAELLDLMVRQFGHNDLSAYLVMMAIRLVELNRVLKPTGSLYLHCDPTASHYLKMILDIIFGAENFRTEITWKRSSAHSDVKQGRKAYGNVADIILYYTKGECFTFNTQYSLYSQDYIQKTYNNVDPDGRRWKSSDLTGPGGAAKGNPQYEFLGVTRYWRYSKANMEQLLTEGRIHQSRPGAVPRMKHYLDEMLGVPLQNIWDDIKPVQSQAKERLGYPTQKPVALLERIIQVSSNPGDIVMDCFCGCGTAVHASQKLDRQWIGIDITHLAIALIEKRLRDAFPDIKFEVIGTPKDLDGAKDLANRDKYQFQWWACSLVNAQPYQGKKKGADSGIDGQIFFTDVEKGKSVIKKIIISVKGGGNVGASMIRDLVGTVGRTKVEIGLFITLTPPTKPMLKEADSAGFYRAGNGREYPRIQILTIEDLLTGHKRPEYWDMSMGELTFKKAQREAREIAEQGYLF